MQEGSKFGFAVAVGAFRFLAAETNTVTLSTVGASGKAIADSVAFVTIDKNSVPSTTKTR